MHILEEAIIYKNELIISIHQLMMVVIILIKTTLIFQLFHIYMAPHYTIMHFSSIFQGVKNKNKFDSFVANKCFPCSNTIFHHSNTFRHLRKSNITAAQQNWYVDVCTGDGGRGRSHHSRSLCWTYSGVIIPDDKTPGKWTSL